MYLSKDTTTFDDFLMDDWQDDTFFGMSHSLPSQPFDTKLETNRPDQDYMEDYTLDPSVFLDTNNIMTTQDLDLILSSDPTFMRQQQILQEQQKQPRSNLSTMLQPINLISSHEQSQNILNNRLSNQAQPIPIASSASTVDHQRRFNELQARFRINNIKKPKQTKSSLGTSMPNTLNEKSSLDKRRLSLDPTSGNKPILKLNRSKPKQPVTIPPSTSNLSSSFPSRTMPIQIQRHQRPISLQNSDTDARQKKLDDQLLKVDFDDITVSELKEMLRQRGKPATGKKAVLVQRLQEELVHARSLPDNIGSLNRSIADMHIGSPPPPPTRRFAPYGTSPRSPMTIAPAPINKSYAPSSLVTPDQEKQVNPFDTSTEELLAFLGSHGSTEGLMDFHDLQFDLSDLVYDGIEDNHLH